MCISFFNSVSASALYIYIYIYHTHTHTPITNVSNKKNFVPKLNKTKQYLQKRKKKRKEKKILLKIINPYDRKHFGAEHRATSLAIWLRYKKHKLPRKREKHNKIIKLESYIQWRNVDIVIGCAIVLNLLLAEVWHKNKPTKFTLFLFIVDFANCKPYEFSYINKINS